MKSAFKHFFLVFIAAWFLFSGLGLSWTESTCLFTGIKKNDFGNQINCCKKQNIENHHDGSQLYRSKCCSYDRYTIKFNFDQTVSKSVSYVFDLIEFPKHSFIFEANQGYEGQKAFPSYASNFSPPGLGIRLAKLQRYQI